MKGFKQFILRGNAVDLAVAVVIGAAFNSVISALVKDLLTPLIAAIGKQPDFSAYFFTFRSSRFLYGEVVNAVISFLIIAAAVYYFAVLPINALVNRSKTKTPPPAPTTRKCPECLSEIPIQARRCAFCTTAFEKAPTSV